ncbi:hypothetical protein CPB97_009268, partial [Podila verticillata]
MSKSLCQGYLYRDTNSQKGNNNIIIIIIIIININIDHNPELSNNNQTCSLCWTL